MTLGLGTGQIVLASNHVAWAEEYLQEKARILEAIGQQILDIRHVGSTSVAGVPAKPILDILVAVESFEEAFVCVAPMEHLGYFHRGEYGIPRRHYFVKGDPRTHHVHMVEKRSRDWRTTLKFRDFLESDAQAAREYREAKEQLASKYAKDRSGYQQEKDKIVERILDRADRNL